MNNTDKPRVFIASATESLEIANSINVSLDHSAEVTVWKDGFTISSNTIDDLVRYSKSVDFAVFIFTPDDILSIRNNKSQTVRDNVLFELGLFISSLGKERCFIIKPRDTDLHFPTDLLGLTPTDYEPNRSDNNLISAVNAPCTLMRNRIKELGMMNEFSLISKELRKRPEVDKNVSIIHYSILAAILKEHLADPDGISVNQLYHLLENDFNNIQVGVAILKLEKNGFIERYIADHYQYGEYYALKITSDGLDLILENENTLAEYIDSKPAQQNNNYIPSQLNNNDIPF